MDTPPAAINELQDEISQLRTLLKERNEQLKLVKSECDLLRTKLDNVDKKYRIIVEDTQNSLRESEKLYRDIVEDQTDLICRFLPNYEHTFVNKAYCNYYQYSPEELIGHSFMIFVPNDSRKELARKLCCLTIDQPVLTHEQHTFPREGEDRWQQWSNRAIFDDSGRIIEFQSAGRDITDRKNMEEALKASEKTLRRQKKSLEEKNTALKEVLKQIGIEKKAIKDQVVANVEELLIPIVNKLRLESSSIEEKYLNLFARTLEKVASSFGQQISRISLKLTNREIEICNMVKTGLSSKEIAELLRISLDTVGVHRNSIRKKLNLIESKQNLSAYLKSLMAG